MHVAYTVLQPSNMTQERLLVPLNFCSYFFCYTRLNGVGEHNVTQHVPHYQRLEVLPQRVPERLKRLDDMEAVQGATWRVVEH
ncbi:hypothetical protein ABB31_04235 [Stenotrophomonas pavanii]|nr:hypothetical protein ABB31_04235 [Stenotrophomonas pavanii]